MLDENQRKDISRYILETLLFEIYKDGKVDAQAHYFDFKTFAVLMDEPLGCKIDPGDDSSTCSRCRPNRAPSTATRS